MKTIEKQMEDNLNEKQKDMFKENKISVLDHQIEHGINVALKEYNRELVQHLRSKLITAKKQYTKSGHDAGYILGLEQSINDIEFFNNTKHLR